MRALFVAFCMLAATPVNLRINASFHPDIPLADLINWMLGFTCKNVIVAPGIPTRATVFTVVAPKQLTPKQAMQLFVDTVESAGLVVVVKTDTIVIKHGPNTPKTCPDLAGYPSILKLYAIRPSTLWAMVGFQNGDTLVSVNGFEINAGGALEIYGKLQMSTSLELDLIRLGKPVTLKIIK